MAGLVSPATLEQIRHASDIVDVIGASLPLKRAGANFVALCPFHKEKSPSFNVNPHKQIFHCFGCHKGGDVFRWVQEYENLSFPEAIRRLAERAGIVLEFDQNPAQDQTRHLKETLLQMHEQITQRWQTALANDAAGQPARDYLAKRGVSAEAIKLFRLGFAPDAWDDTVNWAKSKGYNLATVEQGGLIIRKEGTDRFYDRFRGRLMFPICDEQGRVIGFSGRVLDPEAKAAKYVNSPETPIFTKGKVMFGLDKSKRALLDANSVVVCEGQLDLIACYMAGVHNIVAPQGTAFTAEHARILKRYVEEIVLCFDSDAAGQNAAVRVLDDLLASGLAIRVATVPAPHDPDSFIKEFGGDAFKQLLARAEGFFDFYLKHLCATNDAASDKGRLAILGAMAEAVNKTGNQVLMDTYAQQTALRLAVSSDAVRAEFKKAGRKKMNTPVAPERQAEVEETTAPARPSVQEFWLMKLALADDEDIDWLAAHLDLNWLRHPGVRKILAHRLESHASGQWHGVAAMLSQFEDETTRSLISEALTERRAIPNRRQQLEDLLLRVRNQFIEQRLIHLTQQASTPGLAEVERTRLLHEQAGLRQLKRTPLTPME
ncbi:MAG: DNA primase [Verrucomicrobia bacterium]|nr:DNA primase [Verrucomicrobiota bacterium]